MANHQMLIDLPSRFEKHDYEYGERTSGETHGVVLTKPQVVSLILDLAGYRSDEDLAGRTLLEPSCGHGAFVTRAVDRLMSSSKHHGRRVQDLEDAIVAYDIDAAHVETTRTAVIQTLKSHDVSGSQATSLARHWVASADFLLTPQNRTFDAVVGNPPYVRIEQISDRLQAEYRRRFQSLYDRADLYVAFIEHGLRLLSPTGTLSFICADRWVLNKYGAPLRRLISEHFQVRHYIDLHRASPFDSEVIAYPSIFAIGPGEASPVNVGRLATASQEECESLGDAIATDSEPSASGTSRTVFKEWFKDDEPWVISSPEQLSTLRLLENKFQLVSEKAKVGIGVASGNDKVYLVCADADIESDRLVPLVMRRDIKDGRIAEPSKFVINTFGDDGKLVDLAAYPRLRAYLESHLPEIKKRHVAKKNPAAWFRTIDRVYPDLVGRPKLLIPDIAGSNEVAFDEGHYHPHHNLYFVTSDVWDMEVLGGLLSSRVALFFVWSYATKMRGGYLRFQAQYLRRIRVPDPAHLSSRLQRGIRSAFRKRDFQKLDALALEAYELEALPHFDFVDTRK